MHEFFIKRYEYISFMSKRKMIKNISHFVGSYIFSSVELLIIVISGNYSETRLLDKACNQHAHEIATRKIYFPEHRCSSYLQNMYTLYKNITDKQLCFIFDMTQSHKFRKIKFHKGVMITNCCTRIV